VDAAAFQVWGQAATGGFDFRELGHGRDSKASPPRAA